MEEGNFEFFNLFTSIEFKDTRDTHNYLTENDYVNNNNACVLCTKKHVACDFLFMNVVNCILSNIDCLNLSDENQVSLLKRLIQQFSNCATIKTKHENMEIIKQFKETIMTFDSSNELSLEYLQRIKYFLEDKVILQHVMIGQTKKNFSTFIGLIKLEKKCSNCSKNSVECIATTRKQKTKKEIINIPIKKTIRKQSHLKSDSVLKKN